MESTKPTLTSKTVLVNLALAILNFLILIGVLSSDMGMNDLMAAGGVTALVNTVGNLLSALFRKQATAQLT